MSLNALSCNWYASKKICYALEFELIFGGKSNLILYYWLNKRYDLLLLTLQRCVEGFFLIFMNFSAFGLRKKNSIRLVRIRNLIQWSDFEASNFIFCWITLEVVYWRQIFRKCWQKIICCVQFELMLKCTGVKLEVKWRNYIAMRRFLSEIMWSSTCAEIISNKRKR